MAALGLFFLRGSSECSLLTIDKDTCHAGEDSVLTLGPFKMRVIQKNWPMLSTPDGYRGVSGSQC